MVDINWWAWSPLLLFIWMCVNSSVKAYRIRRGKKQLMDWLAFLGEKVDIHCEKEKHFTGDAFKEFTAKVTTLYFTEVRKDNRW